MIPKTTDLTLGIYRRIYSGFVTGRRINSVSVDAEAFFWRLHAVADDFGNLPLSPIILKGIAAPLRGWLACDIERMVKELIGANLITTYESNRDTYGHIEGWDVRQPAPRNGRRVKKWPFNPNEMGNPGESEAIPMQKDAPIPIPIPIPIKNTVCVVEQKKTKSEPINPSAFAEFWRSWPRHIRKANRKKCEHAWRSNGLDAKADEILSSLSRWKRSDQWSRDGGQYIPAPLVWLNQERWEVEDIPEASAADGLDPIRELSAEEGVALMQSFLPRAEDMFP